MTIPTPKLWGTLALMWLILSSPGFAEAPPINRMIEKSLTQHSDVLAAQAQRDVLLKLLDHSQVKPNPDLGIGLGRKNDGTSSGLTFETTLKQTVLFPGKLSAKKAVALNDIALQDVDIQKLKSGLANTILVKAFQWRDALQRQEVNQQRIRKLSWMKTYMTSRPFVSPQKRLELRLVESDLKSHQLDGIQLKAQADTCRVILQTFFSDPLPESVSLPHLPDAHSIETLHAQLLSQNPEIQAIKLRLNRLELETKLLAVASKPDFDILGRYASESASNTDRFVSLGVGMELPFLQKNRFAIQAQTHQKKALEAQLAQLMKEKERQWQEAVIALHRSQGILELYNPAWIAQLEASLDLAIDGFKKEQTDLLSVLELESQWVSAFNKQYDAKLDGITAWSDLAQLLGKTNLTGDKQ